MIPELNKEYHIFDDGKIKPSRHYTATVIEIIPFEECKDAALLETWRNEVSECGWLFKPQTDYFIKAVSDFDKNPLYFVRTLLGGWFSIDYPDTWMGARLDIDGSLYQQMIEYYGENNK
jgi:hypothetical protein